MSDEAASPEIEDSSYQSETVAVAPKVPTAAGSAVVASDGSEASVAVAQLKNGRWLRAGREGALGAGGMNNGQTLGEKKLQRQPLQRRLPGDVDVPLAGVVIPVDRVRSTAANGDGELEGSTLSKVRRSIHQGNLIEATPAVYVD